MRYKIIPTKGKFRIKYKKGLLGWRTVKVTTSYALEFDSQKQAEDFVKANDVSANQRTSHR